LEKTKKILKEKYSDYINSFDIVMKRKSAHMFNIFIMKKNMISNYCNFLFDILFELEKQTNPLQYNKYQARLYGYISELLLDVWIEKNKLNYVEIPIINIEKIKWLKKGYSFLAAKFLGKKYDGSF
jgi:hypothetical protein